MSNFTYPPAAPSIVGGTALQIQLALKNPTIVQKRLFDITKEKFLGDYLLTERPVATGGALILENGDEVFYTDDDPQAVAPGGEFPLTTSTDGTYQMVRTTKWGLDSDVTDESISRRLIDPVNKAFIKVANSIIRYADGVALSTIASRITSLPANSVAASGSWIGDGTVNGDHTAGANIVHDVWVIKAQREEANVGFAYDYDTVILKPSQLARVKTYFVNSGLLPREQNNAVSSGVLENVLGLNWATSVHVPFTDPFFVDRSQLGGIGVEHIESPGYASRANPIAGGIPVEAKAIREDKTEKWTIRGRRVAVPYVLDAKAGFRITGTGI